MHTTARSWGQATRNTYLEPSLSVGAVTGLRDSSDPASNSAMAFRGKMKVTQEFGAFSSCARPVLPDVGKNGHAKVRVDSDFETMRSNITRTYRDMDYNDNDYYVPPDTCTEESPCVDEINIHMAKGVDISARSSEDPVNEHTMSKVPGLVGKNGRKIDVAQKTSSPFTNPVH
jgi:hypothetical protein